MALSFCLEISPPQKLPTASVCAGLPEHLRPALLVFDPSEDEEQVREAIHVADHGWSNRLLETDLNDLPLGWNLGRRAPSPRTVRPSSPVRVIAYSDRNAVRRSPRQGIVDHLGHGMSPASNYVTSESSFPRHEDRPDASGRATPMGNARVRYRTSALALGE